MAQKRPDPALARTHRARYLQLAIALADPSDDAKVVGSCASLAQHSDSAIGRDQTIGMTLRITAPGLAATSASGRERQPSPPRLCLIYFGLS
jgi:hypothetical protein